MVTVLFAISRSQYGRDFLFLAGPLSRGFDFTRCATHVLFVFCGTLVFSTAGTRIVFLGCVVGRTCGRVPNGKLARCDGGVAQLPLNSGPHHLHGGARGFHARLWEGRTGRTSAGDAAVVFSLRSEDGDEGHPGAVEAEAEYALAPEGCDLTVRLRARSADGAAVNLTSHPYFCLGGSRPDAR